MFCAHRVVVDPEGTNNAVSGYVPRYSSMVARAAMCLQAGAAVVATHTTVSLDPNGRSLVYRGARMHASVLIINLFGIGACVGTRAVYAVALYDGFFSNT